MPFWYCMTSLERRKPISQEMHGPFDGYEEMEKSIREVSKEIKEEDYCPVVVRLYIESEDVPEIVE